MLDETTPQDSAAMPPASDGSLAGVGPVVRKAGDRITREERFKVMEMELNALHAENARLRWRLAAAEIRQTK